MKLRRSSIPERISHPGTFPGAINPPELIIADWSSGVIKDAGEGAKQMMTRTKIAPDKLLKTQHQKECCQ
jgi:hypothetical protein